MSLIETSTGELLTCCSFAFVAFGEFIDAAGRIDEFFLAGEKRMAARTNINADIFSGRTRMHHVPADAGDRGRFVRRMNSVFHAASTPYLKFLIVIPECTCRESIFYLWIPDKNHRLWRDPPKGTFGDDSF